jgi:hypothetical protein
MREAGKLCIRPMQ